jgi:hypothetical protein
LKERPELNLTKLFEPVIAIFIRNKLVRFTLTKFQQLLILFAGESESLLD